MPPSDHSDSSHDSSSDSSGSSYSDSSFNQNDSSLDHGYSDYGGRRRSSANPIVRILFAFIFVSAITIFMSSSLLKGNDIREKLVNLPQVISNVFNGKSGDSGLKMRVLITKARSSSKRSEERVSGTKSLKVTTIRLRTVTSG